jgi:hypothetical protein
MQPNAATAQTKTASPTSSGVYLDSVRLTFIAYNIDGYNYFRLRDVGEALDFGVEWDGGADTIVIDASKGYTPENAGGQNGGGNSGNGSSPQQDDTGARAAAYLRVIDDLTGIYGEGRIEFVSEMNGEVFRGLAFVRLIDFDGDGNDELYCAYREAESMWAETQMIFGFDGGDLTVIMEACRISNPGSDVSPCVIFMEKGDKVYLVDKYVITDGGYFTVRDGVLTPELTYYYDFWNDTRHVLNGAPSSEDEIFAAIDAFEAGGIVTQIEVVYDCDPGELQKTAATIAEIRAAANQ